MEVHQKMHRIASRERNEADTHKGDILVQIRQALLVDSESHSRRQTQNTRRRLRQREAGYQATRYCQVRSGDVMGWEPAWLITITLVLEMRGNHTGSLQAEATCNPRA